MSEGTPQSSTWTVRPAVEADHPAIAGIWRDGWADGHLGHVPDALVEHRGAADFARLAAARIDGSAVAVIGGAVVGFVTVADDEVEEVYVAAAARGSGVAGALLREGECRVAAAGFAVAWLAVVAGNVRARRFYERSGWRDAGLFAYRAEIAGARLEVPCHRYEKAVRAGV